MATQPGWRNIGLATVAREQLMDANQPCGRPAPFGAADASFDRAIKLRQPAVGDVTPGSAVAYPSVRLRVPVVIGDSVRYVLSVPVDPVNFKQLLAAQQLPTGWVIGLNDREKKFIARLPSIPVGTGVSKNFQAALDRASEGGIRDRTLEGVDSYKPYLTSAMSGWVLSIAIPTTLVDAGAWRTFWLTFLGVLAALGVALVLAWWMARRIAAPFFFKQKTAYEIGQ